MAIGSTIILLTADAILSKTIILNFLDVDFILEADHFLVVLFSTSRHDEMMTGVVRDMDSGAFGAA